MRSSGKVFGRDSRPSDCCEAAGWRAGWSDSRSGRSPRTSARSLVPDEFHHHLQPREVAALLRRCDAMLAPSWEPEGFGLPVLEAMACGLPVVASDISAFRGFAGDGAILVPCDRPDEFASAAGGLLGDPSAWRGLRRRAVEAALPFAEERVAEIAEEALYWVAEGRWRSER